MQPCCLVPSIELQSLSVAANCNVSLIGTALKLNERVPFQTMAVINAFFLLNLGLYTIPLYSLLVLMGQENSKARRGCWGRTQAFLFRASRRKEDKVRWVGTLRHAGLAWPVRAFKGQIGGWLMIGGLQGAAVPSTASWLSVVLY